MIVIGIDPHKSTHTATAVHPATNTDLGSIRIDATLVGYKTLIAWAKAWPTRKWAIENAEGLGHHLAQWLLVLGELVLDRSRLCCSSWLMRWRSASMSMGAPSPDSRQVCSPIASDSRFSRCWIRVSSRAAHSCAASRSACSETGLLWDRRGRRISDQPAAHGFSPADRGAGRGRCGRLRPRERSRMR